MFSANYVPFVPSNFKLDISPVHTNLFLHARDTSNVGDLHSSPHDYFTLRGENSVGDFWKSVNEGVTDYDNIIVGGGVFANNFVRKKTYYERLLPRKNLILWGVGTDTPSDGAMRGDFTKRCALIGTRDYNAKSLEKDNVLFCPCASAMNRAFDLPRPKPVHKAVCFLHHNKVLHNADVLNGLPKLNNYSTFTDVLDFLASGEIVVTNSYHGMYWSTLLNKKVVCLSSGGKFAYFKWAPLFLCIERLKGGIPLSDMIPSYPDAIEECRKLNMEFYLKVQNLLIL